MPTDSRKFQEQQISLLSEKFPGLDSGTIEDILAAVDWDGESIFCAETIYVYMLWLCEEI